MFISLEINILDDVVIDLFEYFEYYKDICF